MTVIQRIEAWGETHHPKWMDIVRIALGIFLVVKGIQFVGNYNVLMNLMPEWISFSSFMLILIGHYVVGAHILGGVLLTIGMATRIACIIQIPVLLGAVFFAGYSGSVLHPYANLALAILILILLSYFLIAGNGPWSMDAMQAEEK